MTMLRTSISSVFVGAAVVGACSGTTNPKLANPTLSIAPQQVTACPGDSVAFELSANGQRVNASSANWSSTASNVAAVGLNGVMGALGMGTTTITASEKSGSLQLATAVVTVAPVTLAAPSIESMVRSGSSLAVSRDSVSGAIDVLLHVPAYPNCLSRTFDRAALMIGTTRGSAVAVAQTQTQPLTPGAPVVLTVDTRAQSAAGAALYPDGQYLLFVEFVHHGSFGNDVLSSIVPVTIRNSAS